MSIILAIGLGVFYLINITAGKNQASIDFYIPMLFVVFVFGMVSFIFSKKGLHINKKGLYKAYFVFDILIFKRKVELKNKPIITILKLRKSQNLPSVGIVYPSSSHSFYMYYLYLLNQTHTIKTELIAIKKEENAQKLIEFLTESTNLKFENYRPDFSK
jgi:hypothetical protein